MRTLIISDIHANLPALNAVLLDAEPYDQVWCLGDVVGYGPDPNACIERIRSLSNLKCIKGNHDAAFLGEIDINVFNYEARASLEWLKTEIRPENRRWLEGLMERLSFDAITLVHGSPLNPVWEYVLDLDTARKNFSGFSTQFCIVGHTHIPSVFTSEDGDPKSIRFYLMSAGDSFSLGGKAIINPGSVGQPRDHDPRASYLILDDTEDQWKMHRVTYNIADVQQRIRAAGLPDRHASRLKDGW